MKKIKYYIFAALICATMTSCKSKEESVIDDMSALAEKVEQNGSSFTEEDWDSVMDELKDIESRKEECNFSTDQRREANRVAGKLAATIAVERTKNAAGSLKDAMGNAGAYMNGFMEGLGESDLEGTANSILEDIGAGLKDFGTELNR